MGLFITGVMIAFLLAGCGNGGGTDRAGAEKGDTAQNTEDGEKSMGRYLERELAGPASDGKNAYARFCLERQDDGKIVLADRDIGVYVSADSGESFEEAECLWKGLIENNYVSDVAVSPDGAAAVMCSPNVDYDENAEETVEGTIEETAEECADVSPEELTEVVPERDYYYIDKTGAVTALSYPGGEDEFLTGFRFDREGRLYGFGTDNRVYRFDTETGEAKELFTVEGLVNSACFTGQYMAVVTTRNEILLYDLEEEVLAQEDTVLGDFLKENLGEDYAGYNESCPVIATQGEQKDVLYVAFRGGLYRHVIGGTVMEQVIDGNITAFGDPSTGLQDMVMLPDNEFIVVYSGGKLCKYTYDPNVPTVPEHQIDVYSLAENYSMRQAVSLFQKEHSDVYVHYEIGMGGRDSVTKEDAIRNLNTKIMAGEGPDILLLDGLPRTSYEEKGMLADVSGIVGSMSGEEELFPNIVEACKKDGKLYALPIRIQLPMAVGRKEDVARITDLESLADTVEEIREENREGAILGLKSPEQLLTVLSLTSSAAWTDEKGEIDREALTEFLEIAKRIWQAEISGVDEEWLESEDDRYSEDPSGDGIYYATASTRALNVAMEEQKLGIGKVYRVDFDYDTITSLKRRYEDLDYRFLNGQVENGFIPHGLAGILANSAEDELAVEFYRFLFGRTLQDMDLSGGLPVNIASFDSFAVNTHPDPDGFMEETFAGGLVLSGDDGRIFSLDLFWPSGEEFQALKEMAGSATVMSVGDAAIEEAVLEVGEKMLKDDLTPENAMQEIIKRSAIYLAE